MLIADKATDVFLAESSRMIMDLVKPEVEQLIKKILLTLANALISRVPFDSIFPQKIEQ